MNTKPLNVPNALKGSTSKTVDKLLFKLRVIY